MIKFNNKKIKKEYIEVIPIEYNIYNFLHYANRNKSLNLVEVLSNSNDKDIKKVLDENPILDNIINHKYNIEVKRTILPIGSVCEFSEIEKITCVGDKPLYFFKATFLQKEYDAIYLTYENLFELFNIKE